ncbi:hypothetical protein ABIA35_008849 [Catenulispora sp. MAP12-49]|uniref:hypothetical protein n=1 Tax=Catenulispora sp. MAP12-49 TaxID=3156302 RepID=UPI003517E6EB
MSIAECESGRRIADTEAVKTPGESLRGFRWNNLAIYLAAVATAVYTGFRLPLLWATTFQAVSLQDGFYRRFLIGTVLQPFAALFGYSYWFYTGVTFLALAILLTVLGVVFVRAPLSGRSVLIVVWLLFPTGGFWFNEAGYLDQFLYLGLLAALWLRSRQRVWAAAAVMALTPLVHEIAALTVMPVYAFVVLTEEPRVKRAIAMLVPACVTGAVMLLDRPAAADAIDRSRRRLAHTDWKPRPDVYEVFTRTPKQAWHLYSIHGIMVINLPMIVLAVGGFWVLHLIGKKSPDLHWAHAALATAAAGGPTLLAFAGWDAMRWGYILATNFCLVMWLWWGWHERNGSPFQMTTLQWVVLIGLLLVASRTPFAYLETNPRIIDWNGVADFLHAVHNGTMFRIPPF